MNKIILRSNYDKTHLRKASHNIPTGGFMIPPPFEYLCPNQLSEAISLLQKHGEDAKILAGGHSLIPAMKLRFALPEYLIDIGGIEGMDYLREEGGQLRIGAMTRESSLEDSELISKKYPLLLDTVLKSRRRRKGTSPTFSRQARSCRRLAS